MSELANDAKRPKPRTAREAKMSPRERKLAAQKQPHRVFEKPAMAAYDYGRRLRQIARAVGHLVSGLAHKGGSLHERLAKLNRTLAAYATMLEPWAEAVAQRMLADVDHRNVRAWNEYSELLGVSLRREVQHAPTGALLHTLMHEQVGLITSLPLKAAERVHQIAVGQLYTGARPEQMREEILKTGHVTVSRADLISVTETSRASSLLTQARSIHLGAQTYAWRTVRDGNVRKTHKAQEGKVIAWTSPPKTDEHLAPYHAGQGPRCRCYPAPIIDLDL